MNIFTFIGNILDKAAVAVDETLEVVVVTARTTRKAVSIAELSVDAMVLEQQQELDSIKKPTPKPRTTKPNTSK
jgi:hypothetical protein